VLKRPLIIATCVAIAASLAVATPGGAQATCFGRAATITANGGVTVGTSGPDVIIGSGGDDDIRSGGGRDRVCSGGGDDTVDGGAGADRIDLGRGNDVGNGGRGDDLIRGRGGNDTISGGRGSDTLAGGPGRDDLTGNGGRDDLNGGRGRDHLNGGARVDACHGGGSRDTADRCERVASLTEDVTDTFAGTGRLKGYKTNNRSALPNVERNGGRYRAALTDNSGNKTLHFHGDQGRLDAQMVEFPFDVTVRNIGIGTLGNAQSAPAPNGNPYLFAGVQVHVPNLDDANSSHVVVGHRGGTHFTVEGKNTRNGSSNVNDAGSNIVPDGRADIRIVGNADRTLTVYWQQPNTEPGTTADAWNLYNGTGTLPGTPPSYPKAVYIGLITYAFGSTGVPFVGTADSVEQTPQ
jgi:hypothetical protein